MSGAMAFLPPLARKPRRHALLAGLALATLQLPLSIGTRGQAPSLPEPWFSARSPWNVPIGNAAVAPYSETAVKAYLDHGRPLTMNWGSAGVFVIYNDGSLASRADLDFTDSFGTPWRLPQVPIPPALVSAAAYRLAQRNTDGMTCVVDTPTRRFISLWQPRPTEQGIAVTTGGIASFAGVGWSSVSRTLPSPGRAAGASYCGGLIRESEIRAGEIRHALALVWPKGLILGYRSPTTWRQYPARNTDGTGTDARTAVPMGARLQLAPSLNDAQLRALGLSTPTDFVIAHALQRYGAYVVDSNPPQMGGSLYFESRYDSGKQVYGATNPWPAALMAHLRFVNPPADAGLDETAPQNRAGLTGQQRK